MSLVVEADAPVKVSATLPLRHLCPFKDERDVGEVTITWGVHGKTLELHALRAWLDSFETWTISHEELTDLIRRELAAQVNWVRVVTRWATAGGTVEVTA